MPNNPAFPVQYGRQKGQWTVKQAKKFLTRFGAVQRTTDEWLTVTQAGITLNLRVVAGIWQWAYESRAYSKNGKNIVSKWQFAIRDTAELFFSDVSALTDTR